MEELAKNVWIQLGGFGALIAFLVYAHLDNKKEIKEAKTTNKELVGIIMALHEKYGTMSQERALSAAVAMAASAKAQEEVANRLEQLERAVIASRNTP